MSVSMTRIGQNVTVTAIVSVAGVRLQDYTPAQRHQIVCRLAIDELNRAIEAANVTDEDIDNEYAQRTADINRERDARKASRASGNL